MCVPVSWSEGVLFCPQHFREIVARTGHYDVARVEDPKPVKPVK